MSLYQNPIYVGDSKYTNDSAQIAPLTAYKSYNRQSIARSAEKKKHSYSSRFKESWARFQSCACCFCSERRERGRTLIKIAGHLRTFPMAEFDPVSGEGMEWSR